MDKEKSISNFLEHVERLSRLPLITNSEMNELFGEEVAAALVKLNNYNREKQICFNCQNRCCKVSGCELYASQFSQCPIQDFRPVVCRLHFCHRFHIQDNSLVEELGDIFFDSLLAADRYGSTRVRLFDSPPLARSAPDLVVATTQWVNAVREGSLNPEYAERLVLHEAQKYCIAHTYSATPVEVNS